MAEHAHSGAIEEIHTRSHNRGGGNNIEKAGEDGSTSSREGDVQVPLDLKSPNNNGNEILICGCG